MKKMFVIVSNGFAYADRAVDLDITEKEFKALPTKEQEERVRDAAAEYMDIWVETDGPTVLVYVSLGLVGCDQCTETDYTPAQWEKLYPEEREEHIIEKAWDCVDYFEVAAINEAVLKNEHRGIH